MVTTLWGALIPPAAGDRNNGGYWDVDFRVHMTNQQWKRKDARCLPELPGVMKTERVLTFLSPNPRVIIYDHVRSHPVGIG